VRVAVRLPARPADRDQRVTCTECGVDYRPALTAGDCPVCGVAAPGDEFRPRRLDDRTRTVAMVLSAGIANVLILAVLAVLLLR
jgi:hypothetical protein